jgi:hypothetical protein
MNIAPKRDPHDPLTGAAHRLHARGFHVFPADHPDHSECIGRHGPTSPCDGTRGKHPAVKWGVFGVTVTPQMIDLAWGKHDGLANIAVSCGPSGVVVLDEDADGEIERSCVTYGITLPDTYTVTTGRGRHLYFRWDHTTGRIGSSAKAMDGFKIDVRGDGGFTIAEGSQHASGAVYTGNDLPIAPLPPAVAECLLAGGGEASSQPNWEEVDASTNPNNSNIGFHFRHKALVKYASRLRGKGLDYEEAEAAFYQRWLLCEQPEGQIPEARFHNPGCPYPVTWKEAKAKLADVYGRYAAGRSEGVDGMPKLWRATELKAGAQPRWLAANRVPYGAVSLLIGDEGIGKSLLWGWIIYYVTTGEACPAFGIPARDPGHVILVCTEDGWEDTVRPRLEVAGVDLEMVHVICTEDDGSGAPVFPRDLFLITDADPAPALVVVDAWLDTVPASLSVRDPQQARQALHPWKEVATATGAAVLLLTHTNRVSTANARDRYGATGELRKKARMTLYAQNDEDGHLVVGPEKANSAAPIPASVFAIGSVRHFTPTDDHDGTVPLLRHIGDSTLTARQQLAETYAAQNGDSRGSDDTMGWLAAHLGAGPRWSVDVHQAREQAGISENKLRSAKARLRVESRRSGSDGPWFMALPEHADQTPDVQLSLTSDAWTSGTSGGRLGYPHVASTSQDTQMMNGETQRTPGRMAVASNRQNGYGNPPSCSGCGTYFNVHGHRSSDCTANNNTERTTTS